MPCRARFGAAAKRPQRRAAAGIAFEGQRFPRVGRRQCLRGIALLQTPKKHLPATPDRSLPGASDSSVPRGVDPLTGVDPGRNPLTSDALSGPFPSSLCWSLARDDRRERFRYALTKNDPIRLSLDHAVILQGKSAAGPGISPGRIGRALRYLAPQSIGVHA